MVTAAPVQAEVRAAMRVAVVGAGAFGSGHAQAVVENPSCALVAVVDLDEDARRRARSRWDDHATAVVASLNDVDDVDLVIVATSDAHHVEPALQALGRGAHVLVEKPMATTIADAERIAAAAAASEAIVRVGHLLRCSPPFRSAYAALRDGRWGAVAQGVFVRDGSVDLQTLYRGESTMLQGGIHDIDLACWLVGAPLVAVSALAEGGQDPDHATAMTARLEFATGAHVTVCASRLLPRPAPVAPHAWMWIAAERETFAVGVDGMVTLGSQDARGPQDARGSQDEEEKAPAQDLVAAQLDEMLLAIVGESDGLATAAEGLRALEIALATETSARRGGARIVLTASDDDKRSTR